MFVLDFYSIFFFFVILLIRRIIYFYSQFYMDYEKYGIAFQILLFFFILSILFLVLSPRLIFLLLGWDGLGITSYFLVVFYSNYRSSVAGIVTFLVNRLGDVFFFCSIRIFAFLLDWNFNENKYSYIFLAFFMVLAFITKRAQVPFSSWLPAAIAAPTPVSSLVHSSTLVTAGVYLLIRFSSTISVRWFWLMVVGILTINLAGLIGIFDWDLKKIIAYSTLRQLGFMVASFSCSLVVFTFFHLLTHALFKASLFICAGFVIHSSDNRQDFRNSQRFSFMRPVFSLMVIICLLCLCGFPFTSGFFSKDLLIDGGLMSYSIWVMYIVGVFFTFFYRLRFGWNILTSKFFFRNKVVFFSEIVYYLFFPILFLVMVALCFGNISFESFDYFCIGVFLRIGWKAIYWFFVICSFFLFLRVKGNYFYFFKYFLKQMWFLRKNFTSKIFGIFYKGALLLVTVFDQGWVEIVGPQGWFLKNVILGNLLLRSYFFFLFSFFFFLVVIV